jgi:hypothetical protein
MAVRAERTGETMTRTHTRLFGPILVVASAMIVAVACNAVNVTLPGQSSSATSQPTTGQATTGPGGSILIGVGGAPDLEATLPDQLCGQPSKKQSFAAGGTQLPDPSSNPYSSLLAILGTGAFAVAEPASSDTCKVSAGAFRMQGANQFLIQAFLLAAASDSNGQSTQVNLGGKAATKIDDQSDEILYIYIKGDTIYMVGAPGDDLAGPVLSALP